jgi:glycosyltransferase involved in cell wall biosynthesis
MIPLLSLSLNVYNEEENLERVYGECKSILDKAKITHEIIFIEGGSRDNSWKVLQKIAKKDKNCKILQVEMEPGKKLNAGMRVAKGKYFGYLCSDGQDNPNIIPKCVKLLEEGKADFVKGNRVDRAYWQRKVISRIYNFCCRVIFGLNLRDVNMHPKVFRRELVKNITLISSSESVDLEIVLRAQREGYKIIELPIEERDRDGGKSSVNLTVAINMIRDMISYKWGSKSRILSQKHE